MIIAVLVGWVAVQWADAYIANFNEYISLSPEYFEYIYKILFASLGLIVGFTAASLFYRQATELWNGLLSDISGIPARDKLLVVIGIFLGTGSHRPHRQPARSGSWVTAGGWWPSAASPSFTSACLSC